MSDWFRVEFYGKPPEGQDVISLGHLEVSENLAKVFGFEFVDHLTVVRDRSDRTYEEFPTVNGIFVARSVDSRFAPVLFYNEVECREWLATNKGGNYMAFYPDEQHRHYSVEPK